MVATIEHYGESVCNNIGIIKYETKKDGGTKSEETYKKIVRAKTLDCAVIKRANLDRYKLLLKDITAQYSYGHDLYPKNVEKSHDMINKHELLNASYKKAKAQEWRKQRDADNMMSDHTDTMIRKIFTAGSRKFS